MDEYKLNPIQVDRSYRELWYRQEYIKKEMKRTEKLANIAVAVSIASLVFILTIELFIK